MSKKHQKVLDAIFSGQGSANIHWREVESLFHYLGAELREGGGARVVATLNGQELTLHRPHHGSTMDKHSLQHLRHFLGGVQI